MTIIFDPYLPDWGLILAFAAAALFAGLALWRNWKSGIFRALAVAALIGLGALFGQRKAGNVDGVVEHAHRRRDGLGKRARIEIGALRERLDHEGGEIDRTE